MPRASWSCAKKASWLIRSQALDLDDRADLGGAHHAAATTRPAEWVSSERPAEIRCSIQAPAAKRGRPVTLTNPADRSTLVMGRRRRRNGTEVVRRVRVRLVAVPEPASSPNAAIVKIELDPDPLTGRRRMKWHSGFRTKKDAGRGRTDLLSKLDRGEYVEPSHHTVGDFLLEWLDTMEPTVRPSTFESYSRNVHNHVIAHIGALRLRKVDAGTLNGLYALRLRSGRRVPSRSGQGYSTAVLERAVELRAGGLTLGETAERLRGEFAESDHITKDTLASLLRRNADGGRRAAIPEGLDRRTVSYIHTILHRAFKDAVRWAGWLATGPTPPTRLGLDGRRRASTRGMRRPCGRSCHSRRPLVIGCTRSGSCWRPRACAAARPSDCAGRT
jgi:Phage integrase, N-terminal SAM-like domain